MFDRYFDEVLTKNAVAQQRIFSWEAIEKLRKTHRLRRQNSSPELLSILTFDVWFRHHIRP